MPKAKKAKSLPAKAAGDGPQVKPIFGVTLELLDQEIPISTDSVNPDDGFEFGLTNPVTLGTPDDFLKWVSDTFNIAPPLNETLDPSKLPGPIADLLNGIKKVEIGIIQAHVKVPPKGSQDPVGFTLIFSATFPGDGLPLIPGVLTLKGCVAGASNENASARVQS